MKSPRVPKSILLLVLILVAALVSWGYDSYVAGHRYWVDAAAFHPDGSLLATAAGDAYDCEVILWELPGLKRVATRKLNKARARQLSFVGADQQILIACEPSGTSWDDFPPLEVAVLDLASGEEIDSFREPGVAAGMLHLQQKRLLVSYGYRSIALRALEDSKFTPLLHDPEFGVNRAAASRNERFLIAGCDGIARLWHLDTREQDKPLDAQGIDLGPIAVSEDGQFAAAARDEFDSQADDFPLLFWDRSQGTSAVKIVRFSQPVTTLQYLPGEQPRLLVVWGKEHVECGVAIYDTSGELLHELYSGKSAVKALDVSQDGTRLVWETDRQPAEMWSLAEAEPVRLWTHPLADLRWIQFSPDGSLLAGHEYAPNVWLFDAATGERIAMRPGYEVSSRTTYLLSMLPVLLLLAGLSVYQRYSAKQRADAMRIVAKQLGWQHTSGALPASTASFQFFAKRPNGRFEHVLLPKEADEPLLAMYSWVQSSDDKHPVQELCAIYPSLSAELPDLLIRPESLADKLAEYVGFTDIDLDGNSALLEFSSKYLLRSKAGDRMEEVISDSLAEFLCHHEGWSFEVLDGSVLFWWQRVKSFTTSRFPIDDAPAIRRFLDESQVLANHLLTRERRPR